MSFLKKLFGNDKKEKAKPVSEDSLPWIEPSENRWQLRLLDLRPISETMISSSRDPQMATNAISFIGQDGTFFWGVKPASQRIIPANISIPIDDPLEPGVLFMPDTMEHKWAIYFDGENLIFIRSWTREVLVIAKTSQKSNLLMVENITGEFTEGESPAFTQAVLNFLLISHSIDEVVPAPLPKELEPDTRNAGLWAFSTYGNKAHIGVFDENFLPSPTGKLRSHSLLHIAVAKSDIAEIEKWIKNGTSINALAGDGLATLQWAIANESVAPMQKLLELGADPNVRSTQGATPIMNAVQSNKTGHLNMLLNAGALVNAIDNRGFTALHRAAGMGHIEIVKILLANGADKTVEAEGQTALSLATTRGNKEIIELLLDK